MPWKKRKSNEKKIRRRTNHLRRVEEAVRERERYANSPVCAVHPKTRGIITFSNARQARKFLGMTNNYSLHNAIYQRRIYHGYYWCYEQNVHAFINWEFDRIRPLYEEYMARTPHEDRYLGVSLSAVDFRYPVDSWTL